ncbi:hypothetical protein IQ264_15520 [Phormidium sp. LEGE 05292]|uniref:hypothetical protein n=1 Tax=[Phormidium] sp. LEGE 05292 TaxID=767427 RepID=UPI00187FB1D7|nr:hypothetical protein [Phormidium sp. LEGE 05292]MBE9226836.1 hypothetical protein [Phormidium sp. LEGE 05292]
MQVIQRTFTLLTLRERPIGIWVLSSFTATIGLLIFISSLPPLDWFGFFCIICANFMMFGSPEKICLFDKSVNRVTFKQKGWLGNQYSHFPITKISLVEVEPFKLFGIQFYRLSLKLLSGEIFYLTPIPSTDDRLLHNLAGSIQEFIRY